MSGLFFIFSNKISAIELIHQQLFIFHNFNEFHLTLKENMHICLYGSLNPNIRTKELFIKSDLTDLYCIGSIYNQNEIQDNLQNASIKFNNTNDINSLRGSFVGILKIKKTNEINIFVDQTGSKPLYYCNENDVTIISSSLYFLSKLRNLLGNKNSPDKNAYYEMLSFGYMLNDDTYISNVKKLFPGKYININERLNKFSINTYYNLSTIPKLQGKTDELIEELAVKYKKTINLIFTYDKQFNKSHCVLLSGGLDSRIIVGFAHQLGFKNISSLNFAQSFSQDNESAQQIAEKFKIDFIFNSLNFGNYLIRYVDEIIKANDGLIFFSGAAHMYDTLKKINVEQFGLIHTGMLIDGILGGYMDTSKNKNWYQAWGESNKLIRKIDGIEKYINIFNGREEFNCINRGINAISNGYRMIEKFTEFSSPSCDWHLVDFGFRLPDRVKYRKGIHEILKYDLVIRYLPELRWILYHNNLSPVIENKIMISLFHLLNNIKRVMLNKMYFSQNPFSKWLKYNNKIISTLNSIFQSSINLIHDNELKNDIINHFTNGNFTEKVECITVLKATELHNINI